MTIGLSIRYGKVSKWLIRIHIVYTTFMKATQEINPLYRIPKVDGSLSNEPLLYTLPNGDI